MKACQRLQFARLVGAAILVTVWGLGHSNATASSPPVDTVPEVVEDIPYNVSKPSYQGGLLGYNVNVSNLEGNESEVSIDVDPTDPDNQVVVGHAPGFVTMNTFYTMDGGLTWTLVEIDDDVDGLNSDFRIDPTVAFDDDGNVYVGYLARMATQTSVVVCQSTDKGVTYPQCTVVATTDDFEFENELFLGNDKLHLATGPDPDNLTKQNVYIAWTQNVTEDAGIDQRIVLSASTDEGMTFSAPVIINDGSKGGTHAGSLFADPAVGPLGEVYVAWHDIDAGQVFVDVSYDGGATFGTDNLVTTSGTGFKTSIPPQPGRGVHVGPTIDADRSDGPFGGRLYVTYVDLPTDENDLPDTDIFVRYSDDDGATWSARTRVNDDEGTNSQFLPWLDVDQQTGLVSAVWYDARNDDDNERVEIFIGVSTDGGDTFQPNILVSDAASDQSGSTGNNYLEYIGIAALSCTGYPVWSDNSNDPADLDYFTDQVSLDTPPTIDSVTATPNVLWPPNHKMVPVAVNVLATDICDQAAPTCEIITVSSNEPPSGKGSGRTAPDWEITGPLTVDLRAERSGKGSGREYTIATECTDTNGNTSTETVIVTVPHDQRG